MNRKIFSVFLLAALPFLGLSCTRTSIPTPSVTLNYWRVFDGNDAFDKIINDYHKTHPYVTINYRELNYGEYEQALLNAWAEDRGPDLFSIHNTWIGKYQNKIAPLPATLTVPVQYVGSGFTKQLVTELSSKPGWTPDDIRTKFVDVVGQDVIRSDSKNQEHIYGVPLSVDTLVMFYNKDLLNRAGIPTVPTDWKAFIDDVSKITKIDDNNNLVVSGTALGTAKNIPRFTDILSTLMMQNGAIMADAHGFPTFAQVPASFPNKDLSPGIEALKFYTDFANPGKQSYSWNDSMPSALTAFTQGQVAFYFGYAYDLPTIRAHTAQFGWGLAPIPQVDAQNNKINFANYWVETVSKKSKNQTQAWDFLQFAASEQNVGNYLSATSKPTALRSLIDEQRKDTTMKTFADALLTAQSWYRGLDAGAMEQAMTDLVDGTISAINSQNKNALKALINTTTQRIAETITPPKNAP